MDANEIRYWEAVVQLIPVLTLAVLIEARAVSKQWTQATPTFVRVTDGSMWALIMVGLAFSEVVALKAIRTGESSSHSVASTTVVIVFAFIVLVWVVAVELLMRAYAEVVAWAFSRHPRHALSGALFRHQARRVIRRVRRRLDEVDSLREMVRESRVAAQREFDAFDVMIADLEQDPDPTPASIAKLNGYIEKRAAMGVRLAEADEMVANLELQADELQEGLRADISSTEAGLAANVRLLRELVEADRKATFSILVPPADAGEPTSDGTKDDRSDT